MATKEDLMKGLIKACTDPDGTMYMDPEDLEEIAEYLSKQPNVVDPKDGLIKIKKD